jgi:nucleoside-diphosphate-sugar epimerase
VYGLVRNKAKATNIIKGEVKVVVGNPPVDDSLVEAVKLVDMVINAAADYSTLDWEPKLYAAIEKAFAQADGPKKTFIFTSGNMAYESSRQPHTEESPAKSLEFLEKHAPECPMLYGILKERIPIEQKVLHSKTFNGVVVRPPLIYGGEKGRCTVYFQQGEQGKVVVYGKKDTYQSVVHIDDVANAFVRIVEAETEKVKGQIFNLGETTEKPSTLTDFAVALAKGAGCENPAVEYEPWPAWFSAMVDNNSWLDSSKAKRVLGWSAKHNFHTDAKVLYDSWKAYGTPAQW